MAKPKKVELTEINRDPEGDFAVTDEDLTGEERDALIALTDIEGGSEARWQVYRIPPLFDGKTEGFQDELTSSELSMVELQRRFGRGHYKIKGMKSNGDYLKQVRVKIGADARGASSQKEVVVQNSSGDAVAILERINEREEKAAERRRELMLAAIPAAIAALPAIFQAMGGRRESPLEMMAALKTLQPNQPDMSGLIGKLIEVAAGKSDGGGSSETNWMDLVKEGMAQLGPVLGAKLAGIPTMPPVIPSQAVARPQLQSPTVQAQPAQPAQEDAMLKLLNWSRATLAMLTDKAAKMKDPSLYADVVMDDIPEGVDLAQFVQYLNAPNWWEWLQNFYPAVTPYKEWFAQFREDLLGAWEESQRDIAPESFNDEAKKHTATVHEFKPGTTAPAGEYFSESVEFPPDFEPPNAS
jgi:hypothetical protein